MDETMLVHRVILYMHTVDLQKFVVGEEPRNNIYYVTEMCVAILYSYINTVPLQ